MQSNKYAFSCINHGAPTAGIQRVQLWGLTGDNPGKRERIITVGFLPAAAAAVVKVMSFVFRGMRQKVCENRAKAQTARVMMDLCKANSTAFSETNSNAHDVFGVFQCVGACVFERGQMHNQGYVCIIDFKWYNMS